MENSKSSACIHSISPSDYRRYIDTEYICECFYPDHFGRGNIIHAESEIGNHRDAITWQFFILSM